MGKERCDHKPCPLKGCKGCSYHCPLGSVKLKFHKEDHPIEQCRPSCFDESKAFTVKPKKKTRRNK